MKNPSEILECRFDDLLFQIIKGRNTHKGIERGSRYEEFEQIKEWKSRYGYKFEIFSNDHFIKGKPHFHLTNFAKNTNCRLFFSGETIDCKGKSVLDKRIKKELTYFLSNKSNVEILIEFWNLKNPNEKFSSS